MDDRPLSVQLDEALAKEEYYRDRLLFWRQRRRELERLVSDSYNHLRQQINELFGDSNDANNGN